MLLKEAEEIIKKNGGIYLVSARHYQNRLNKGEISLDDFIYEIIRLANIAR